jgi:hypothetical protein
MFEPPSYQDLVSVASALSPEAAKVVPIAAASKPGNNSVVILMFISARLQR